MPGPILFVSHDASRTGAPIALLNLLKHFRRRGEPSFEVVLRDGGDLVQSFEALAPVTHWPVPADLAASSSMPRPRRSIRALWRGAALDGRHGSAAALVTPLDKFRALGISLIYSNTITNGEVLAGLAPLGVPVISHVHELDYWMSHRMSRKALRQARDHTDLFIAASQAVARCLSDLVGVSADRIVTVHESIELPDTHAPAAERAARARYGIPEHAFVIGASGTMDWRKGVDLLAPLAAEVARRPTPFPVHWMWVGGERNGPAAGMLQHDFARCGLAAQLHLTGTVERPLEAFLAMDTFVVLSREDPFPLVMLEAAAIGLPILCFEGAGGAPEFVRDDAGFVVPYLHLPAMAAHLSELCTSPQRRRVLGDVAQRRVMADHDVALVAPRIADLIQQVLARGKR